ncbi:hypothetical protein [Streptomyces sp. enrichment culture]|uniref:hypothetical protein n=1 Tax=Streptomyces sp. enrichment culture TaxID=1795815 RepID=UPI003F558EE0
MFRATVRADRLRFVEEPRTAVRFPGTGKRTSTSRSERTNVPGGVVAGKEYRDALIVYRLATRLTGQPEDGRDAGDGAGA